MESDFKRKLYTKMVLGSAFWVQRFRGSAQPLAKKTARQIDKETINSPQSSQRALRKKKLR
jgi:hypothetical protein